MQLIEHYRFSIINISQFYPRPGTPAAKMKRIPTDIVKGRSRRLTQLFESLTPYTHLVGRTERVWFDREISSDGQHIVGHNKSYVKVLVPLDNNLPGTSQMVSFTACHRFHVEGHVVGNTLTNAQNNVKCNEHKVAYGIAAQRPYESVPMTCATEGCGDDCDCETSPSRTSSALPEVQDGGAPVIWRIVDNSTDANIVEATHSNTYLRMVLVSVGLFALGLIAQRK